MSEVENQEIEMTSDDVRREAIRTMMQQWKDGNLTDAQDTFNNILGTRADELVDDRKAELAASIYNKPEGEIVDNEGDNSEDEAGDQPFDAVDYMEPESEEEPEEAETDEEV